MKKTPLSMKEALETAGWKFHYDKRWSTSHPLYMSKKISKKREIDIEFCIGDFCVGIYGPGVVMSGKWLIEPKKRCTDFISALVEAEKLNTKYS